LLPDDTDRARLLDMDRRLQPIRKAALGVLAGGLLIMGPWVGWWTLAPLAVAALLFYFADRRMDQVERPEYWIFGAWIGSQTMILISVLLAWAPGVPVLSWFAIPVITLGARFSARGIYLGLAITIAMMAIVGAVNLDAIIDEPPLFVMPLCLVIAIGILSTALMRSYVEHRTDAVIDPLTATLNRKALVRRVEELRQQSEVLRAPISVVMLDIDHFKRVNDTIGHAGGDAVLRDVAYLIRKEMRAFELAYRLGGEEFLVLLPGATVNQARDLAERLRRAIEGTTFTEGTGVTISLGVSGSRPGEEFDFDALYEEADEALYEAKRGGRNRVGMPERIKVHAV
jgi:diguanylate cyclase (GGDEF)-like protein